MDSAMNQPKQIRITTLLLLLMLVLNLFSLAQNLDSVMAAGGNRYKDIVRNAEAYFAKYGTRGTGYNQYMRWKAMVKPNILDDGRVPDMDALNKTGYQKHIQEFPPLQGELALLAGVANWQPWGQATPTIAAGRNQNGSGSVRCIEWQGNDMWVGTPGGGIWFGDLVSGTTYNWSPRTDGIPNLAITDIEIAPTNNSIMYALTGAVGSASGYRSTGVLKSTDGGGTWNPTGLTFPENGNDRGYRILVNPANANIVWVASTQGLWRTTDGGLNWNLCTFFSTVGGAQTNMSGAFFEILYRPGSSTTMYATGAQYFYRSTDGGQTFLRVNRTDAGLPTTGGSRISMAVAPSNSNVIYLLYANGNAQQGVYRSGDGGTTFTLQNGSTNMLGSQAWRNISIVCSPSNSNHLYAGGLDVYKSTDAGVTWDIISDWSTTTPSLYSHADIFELYCTTDFLFGATDGGVFRMDRTNDAWTPLHRNMQIAQAYRLAVDPAASPGFVLMGNQDCGTYLNTGASYINIAGADGMESLINPANTQDIYISTQNGNILRSTDRGTTAAGTIFSGNIANNNCGNCGETGAWVTPIRLRPGNNSHIYVGYQSVYFNTSSGTGSWTRITPAFANPIDALEFAPSNNTIMYATDGTTIARYNFANGAWTRTVITGNLPVGTNITRLAVDPNNANAVVLSVGGYTDGRKVFFSTNANNANPTWNNISRNLPNVPINTVIMAADAANTIYLGSDIGVFVTNDNRVNWLMYTNGLPATRVYDLEINTAAAPDRIFAATFGRGVYSAEIYTGCSGAVSLTGTVDGLKYTESSSGITSVQLIKGGSGTSVAYNSGTVIQLNPGFEAKSGSFFEAYIQGCTSAGNPPRPLQTAPDSTKAPEQHP
jgi:hypothetical protein